MITYTRTDNYLDELDIHIGRVSILQATRGGGWNGHLSVWFFNTVLLTVDFLKRRVYLDWRPD